MSSALGDLRHAVRQLLAAPGFFGAASVTLALAIGANTVIFSFVNALLLRPLPLAAPERLGWVSFVNPENGNSRWPVSLPEYAAFRDGTTAFATFAARQGRAVAVARQGELAERVLANAVVGDLHGVWGVRAHIGRTLRPEDERPDAPRVAVLSHRYWTRRFGASPAVVGETWRVDGGQATIVGVLAPDIEIGNISEIAVWLPYQGDPRLAPRTDRSWRTTGRLGAGATIPLAHAQVEAVAQQLERDHPDTNRSWRARAGTTKDALAAPNVWVVLSLLATAVGLLLLLACANITNMLLARLAGRRQELAVRTALGATRGRLVRQLLTEGLLLGAAGGALGLGIGWTGTRAMQAAAYEPFFELVRVDPTVVLFAVALALAAPLAFTVLPVLGLLGRDLRTPLHEQTRRSLGGRGAGQRRVLVVAQLALAVALLGAAGLVVRTMVATFAVPYGFGREGLLTWQVDVPVDRYPADRDVLALRERLVEQVGALGGVGGVASVTSLPVLRFEATAPVVVDGRQPAPDEARPAVARSLVSPGYFEVMGIPRLRGRTFGREDRAGAPEVAVISREAARRFWGEAGAAVGATLLIARDHASAPRPVTVVGVVGDVANPDLEQAPQPHVYLADTQGPARQFAVVVRASGVTSPDADAGAAALAEPVRKVLHGLDPDLAPYQLRTYDDAAADEQSSNVIIMSLFIAFAVVAVLLAAAGMYGVMAYTVSQRTPELAVRMALGASRGDIGRQMFGEAVRLTAVGVGLGVPGALLLGQGMASLLFGVSPTDLPTHAAVVLLALTTVTVAVWLPVRRAIRVDPLESLRQA